MYKKCLSLFLISAMQTSFAAETAETYLERAKTIGSVLHTTWYNSSKGQWIGTYKGPNDYWWHSANSLMALINLIEVSDYQISAMWVVKEFDTKHSC